MLLQSIIDDTFTINNDTQSYRKQNMKNRNITKDEICKITEICKIREQTFFTIMRQSGLTPNIIKQLKIKDLEKILEPNTTIPCKIELPQETQKGKFRPPTFIGQEATRYIKQYLKTERENPTLANPIFTTYNNPNKEINIKDVSRTFKLSLQKLKKEKIITYEERGKGKPSELRLSSLTKFYEKNAENYLLEVKNNPDKEDEFYRRLYEKKALPFLEIETPTTTELKDRIEKIENMIPIFVEGNNGHEKPLTDEEIKLIVKKIREHKQRLRENPSEAKQEYERMQDEEIQNLKSDIKILEANYEALKESIDNIKNILQKNPETKK
jgi:hypothetical protein